MIYCSCGGQKSCFKCDGKGWIDELECERDEFVNLPPVLKEYSNLPELNLEKIDFGRRKPLIAQVQQDGFSVPRSAASIAAARAKKRKEARAARTAKTLEISNEPEETTVRQLTNTKVFSTNSEVHGKPIFSLLTNEQTVQLAEQESKLAILIEILSGTGDVTEKVNVLMRIKVLINEELRAIGKLHIKARKVKNK